MQPDKQHRESAAAAAAAAAAACHVTREAATMAGKLEGQRGCTAAFD
jgi:hypothetical protein